MLVAGKWDLFVETMKKNIAAVKEAGADTVVTSLPGLRHDVAPGLPGVGREAGHRVSTSRPRHYSEVVAEKLASGEFEFPEKVEADGAAARDAAEKVPWPSTTRATSGARRACTSRRAS